MNTRSVFFILLISILVISSCTLQKRYYQSGYYLHFKSTGVTPKSHESISFKNNLQEKTVKIPFISNGSVPELYRMNISKLNETTKDTIKSTNCGDSLWTLQGNLSLIKVIEVSSTQIKYKRCANLNGPIITISKDNVSKLKYSNGTSENLLMPVKEEYKNPKGDKPPKHYANSSFTAALIFLFGGAIATLFLILLPAVSPLFGAAVVLGIIFLIAGVFAFVQSLTGFRRMKETKETDPLVRKKMRTAFFISLIALAIVLALILINLKNLVNY